MTSFRRVDRILRERKDARERVCIAEVLGPGPRLNELIERYRDHPADLAVVFGVAWEDDQGWHLGVEGAETVYADLDQMGAAMARADQQIARNVCLDTLSEAEFGVALSIVVLGTTIEDLWWGRRLPAR